MANIDELKSTGLKATLPRLKILEIFQKGQQRHMTAEDVFRVLLGERSDVGLATVYRVLTQFEQAGILSRSHFESGQSHRGPGRPSGALQRHARRHHCAARRPVGCVGGHSGGR